MHPGSRLAFEANAREGWLVKWLEKFFRRESVDDPVAVPEDETFECPTAPVPVFIKVVAQPADREQSEDCEFGRNASANQSRNPARALSRLRRGAARPSTGRRARARSGADSAESIDCGTGLLQEIDPGVFTEGTVDLEHRNGAEHNVLFDPATSRVIKLTQPGEFGAWGGLEDYLQRLAWCNELFDDDWLVEGRLHYPNEPAPRVVTSQPWYRVDPERPEPTLAEIDSYMRQAGFLKAYDGAWLHPDRDIAASDALPKNFVFDVAGHVHPIDVILLKPDDEQRQRLRELISNQA